MSYSYSRDVIAGCFTCWGSEGHWHGPNAQGVAARHHQAHGHPTWVDVNMSIFYGKEKPPKEKQDESDRE